MLTIANEMSDPPRSGGFFFEEDISNKACVKRKEHQGKALIPRALIQSPSLAKNRSYALQACIMHRQRIHRPAQ